MKKVFYTLLLFLFSTAAFSQAVPEAYMTINDATFKGDSPREAYKNSIVVYSTSNAGSNTMIAGKQTLKFQDFAFTQKTGVNTPNFFVYLATQKIIPKITIDYVATDMNGEQYVSYEVILYNAFVTSVSSSFGGDCTYCRNGLDTITLGFGKISWESKDGKTIGEWTIAPPKS